MKLNISAWEVWSASSRPSASISDDVPVHLTNEHLLLLQRFFNPAVVELKVECESDSSDLPRQHWDIMITSCNRREYARRKAKAAKVDIMHSPSLCKRDNSSDEAQGSL